VGCRGWCQGSLTLVEALRVQSPFSIFWVLWMVLQLETLARDSRAAQYCGEETSGVRPVLGHLPSV
jgi:hypothetical protein